MQNQQQYIPFNHFFQTMRKLFTLVVIAVMAIPLFAQSWSKDLEKTAKAGDVEAQVAVGNAYLSGDGVKQDPKKAAKWLYMAAQAGNAKAVETMCTFYSKDLEKLAKEGNAAAQFAVANFYAEGNGVKQNEKAAFEWYGQAAVGGIAEAKPKVLVVYSTYLEQLAAAGDADAQFALANFYAAGNGVAQDTAKALDLYGSAAAQGIAEAKQKVLGSYNSGLEKLAKAGDAEAQFALANFYATGDGVAQDTATAMDWYGACAAQGNAEAKQKVLGSYNSGLEKLAKAGDAEAATQMAEYLFKGTGGATKNEKMAGMYYAIAYDAGNADAGTRLLTLSEAYISGRGVAKNEDLGYVYLELAAKAGIEEAKDKFYSTMSPQLERAAERGDVDAMIAMARLNNWGKPQRGESTVWDINNGLTYDGLKWILRAIEKGYIDEVMNALKEDKKELPDFGQYLFSGRNGLSNFECLKGWVPVDGIPYESAYYAALLRKDKSKAEGVKSLMNQYNHPKARELYDDWYFQFDCTTYEIVSIPGVGYIKGLNEFPNKVQTYQDYDYTVYDTEAPTSEELQKLVEFNPDFAFNQDGVRVIRGFTVEGNSLRWVVDVFFLPGLIAYGPDSYIEIVKYSSPKGPYSYDLSLSNPYKIRFNRFANEDTKFSEAISFTGTFAPEEIKENFKPIKSITTISSEMAVKFTDLKLFEKWYENDCEEKPRHYCVIDGSTVELRSSNGFGGTVDFNLNSYTIKGEDGSEYSLLTKEYSESLPEDVRPIGEPYYRMKYTKPDGSKMDVMIDRGHVSDDGKTFDYMKKHINAALLDSLFMANDFTTVIAEDGTMTRYRYGVPGSEYDAMEKQKEKEAIQREVQAFKDELYKKYDKQMVDKYFSAKGILVKGVSINLVSDYLDHYYSNPREKWIEFYLTDSEGYGIYKLSEGNVIYGFYVTAYIYTRNGKIVYWINQ